MQTATVEVKYVNPPKEGKKMGSIKDTGGDLWPVKAERIHEFEPGGQYQLAYTQTESGFRNLIGVKRIVAEPELPRGQFTQVPPQRNGATLTTSTKPQQNGYAGPEELHPKASTQEQIFATGGIYRDIEANRVGPTEDELVERVILWRNVYRRAFPE